MGRLKLQPNPTFKAKVGICIAGGNDEQIEFTFKHRTKDDLQAFIEASADRDDADSVLEMCTAWDLTDPFTRESVEQLAMNYIGSPRSIFDTYINELTKGRAKN